MTTYSDLDLDRILDEFLGEGPAAAPERAIDAALDRIVTVGQRRSPAFSRRFRFAGPARLLLAAALVLALIGAGVLILGSRRTVPEVLPPVESVAPAASLASPSFEPTASPSTSPLPAVTPEPVSAAVGVALEAVNRADRAVTATKGPLGINDSDQSRLLQLIDDVHSALIGIVTDPSVALESVDAFSADAIARTESLGEQYRVRLRTAVAALRGAVDAQPFVDGPLDAGTWYTGTFTPATALTLGSGWTRALENGEALVLTRGDLTLAVTTTATDATENGIAESLGSVNGLALEPAPARVTFPSYVGFMAGYVGGAGSPWPGADLQAFEPGTTDAVRRWVLQAGNQVVTVTLVGPPAAVEAAIDEVETMLGTIVVSQR